MELGVFHVLKNTVDPKVGPNQTLSQLTGHLIERWDSLTDEEKMVVELFIDWDEVLESITPAFAESVPEDPPSA